MWPWPTLELTDYERKFVRIYKTSNKPGVLAREYKITLNSPAQPDKNLPIEVLSGNIKIARRSRVYGLMFSGDVGSWRLNISNASGTIYTVKDPRRNQDPVVSSLLPGTYYNSLSLGGLPLPLVTGDIADGIGPDYGFNQQFQSTNVPFPLLIDPNWVLLPNETLIFTGTPLPVEHTGEDPIIPRLILNIGVHVWEFPIIGTASADEREVL